MPRLPRRSFRSVRALSAGVLLRGASLGGRLLLLLAIARYLTLADVGAFGIFSAAVVTAVLVLGLDFHAYSSREIAGADARTRVRLIANQWSFHAVSYCVLLPAAALAAAAGLVPRHLLLWWLGVLVAEHVATELYRLLIVLRHPTAANVALFLRAAAWGIAAAGLFVVAPQSRSLTTVWIAWLLGAGSSVLLAAWTLRYLPWKEARPVTFDTAWLTRGAVVMLPFLVASLSLKVVEYSDRFFLSGFVAPEAVGQFTFLASLANALQALVHSSVVAMYLPRLLRASAAGTPHVYEHDRQQMFVLTVLVSTLCGGGLAVAIGPLATMLHLESVVPGDLRVLWWLLLANVLTVISWVFHYDLYARGRDRHLLLANLAGAACTLALHTLLIPAYGPVGAAVASVSGVGIMLALKFGWSGGAIWLCAPVRTLANEPPSLPAAPIGRASHP